MYRLQTLDVAALGRIGAAVEVISRIGSFLVVRRVRGAPQRGQVHPFPQRFPGWERALRAFPLRGPIFPEGDRWAGQHPAAPEDGGYGCDSA